MISQQVIETLVAEYIAAEYPAYYIVDVLVHPGNRIVVELGSDEGVDIDACVRITKHIEANQDREIEDYELEVGSAGLTSPFKVLRQYEAAIDEEVEVLRKGGIKEKGVLSAVSAEQIELSVVRKVKLEGAKRKTEVEELITIPMDEILSTKRIFTSMIDSLAEFKDLKNISKETMVSVLESAFLNVLSKIYGTDRNFTVLINPDRGDFEIWRKRRVVENGEVVNENDEIALRDAQLVDADCEVGDEVSESVNFNAFGRRAVINLRQALASKILELQKDNFFARFKDRVGELITAEVYQVWKREALLIDEDGNELILPKNEQIPGDFFRKGETVRAVIERVENENNNPKVILSRSSGEFLKRLLELNVPEINDGLITLRAIARIPGERAKIAVESYDDRIDPVGACVGMNGSRIRGIVRELRGENIDVTTYTSNTLLFIQRALSPAKVSAISLDNESEPLQAEVYLRPEEVPLAIGKNASNLKLASLLTGYRIEVFRDNDNTEEDIYLDEFADEIDSWIIDLFKNIGCTTAKSVLKKSREELISATDLEEATLDQVISVLRSEFSDEELDEDTDDSEEEEA